MKIISLFSIINEVLKSDFIFMYIHLDIPTFVFTVSAKITYLSSPFLHFYVNYFFIMDPEDKKNRNLRLESILVFPSIRLHEFVYM